MRDQYLHIVSFDIPYPPNYGGVIDVFYKLKSLHKKGVKVILHAFEYPGRDRSEKLKDYCHRIHYYPRLLGLRYALYRKPYIVASRKSNELLENLLKDNYPVLFEGMHSCFYLDHPKLTNRFKIYRESNIEHLYYINLFKVDKNLAKRMYYLGASIKLMMYQKTLKNASLMLAVSQEDTEYLRKYFPGNQIEYLPSFHANDSVNSETGKGKYALYNGNIEVPENAHAVEYLMREVFDDLKIPLIIAGMNPPEHVINLAKHYDNVEVIPNPDDEKMFDLIKNAHINILVTFQATGLKLKLLNTLYNGKFCLVNNKMLNGTGLEDLCVKANSSSEFKSNLKILIKKDFTNPEIKKREKILSQRYSNDTNAEKLISLVFGEKI